MRKLLALILLVLFAGVAPADVVLTIPEAVRSEVGGAGTVNYDRIRTLSITVSPVDDSVSMEFELYSSADAARPPYRGRYVVQNGVARVEIQRLGFEAGKTLTNPQKNNVVNAITSHVAQVEASMASFGLVDGVQQ